MKNPIFTGVCTALVTPFKNGKINYDMLDCLLERQLSAGISAIVLSGTTGESPTLSDSEKLSIFRHAKNFCGNDCTIIAGTGSNNTRHTITLSEEAEQAGADALLIISPYYNKSTSEGLYAHYSTVCSAVHIPVIIYNVPSRTGQDIPVSVYQKLAKISNMAGVKEASTSINKALQIKSQCPADFSLWSGNDDMAVPVLSLGGAGVISVLSNIYPLETQAMAMAALAGDFDTASSLQIQLYPLITLLFREVNPIPVKAAMELIGYDCGPCRMPLSAASQDLQNQLRNILAH
jgi:4-hydroxy-tetrahydrodipicolinate synthase